MIKNEPRSCRLWTGAAQFESISKAVFLRFGLELKTLDNLRAELAGNAR